MAAIDIAAEEALDRRQGSQRFQELSHFQKTTKVLQREMCHFKAWLSLMKWNMFSFHGSSVVRWPCLKATGVEVERTQAQRINREVEMSETCLLYFCDFVVCDSLRSQTEHFQNHIVSILGPFWWKAENAVHGNHLADKHTLQKISSRCSSVENICSVWEIAHYCILHCQRARNKAKLFFFQVIHRQNVHQKVADNLNIQKLLI